jgi:dTDP-D-glucose 4,6-dehydratase
VSEIAQLIQQIVYQRFARFVPINTVPSQDNRSYHINSDKIFHVLGFKPKRTVEDAIRDICIKFEQGYWPDSLTNSWYTNVLQYTEKYGFGKVQAA